MPRSSNCSTRHCAVPIAVGGGVVLAPSYEAKHFGVRSGMSGWRARELCPQLTFVGGHFGDYQRLKRDEFSLNRFGIPKSADF